MIIKCDVKAANHFRQDGSQWQHIYKGIFTLQEFLDQIP
jgi:hypothetical protein